MTMDAFAGKICAAVKGTLGEEFHTEVREVRKNNGVILHGLVIQEEGQRMVPIIYLEYFLETYESGMPFEAVVCRLLSVYKEEGEIGSMDMEFFMSYEKVKDRICYRLIRRKGNEEMLEGMPHVDFLDLAVCFYYDYCDRKTGNGTIQIHNSHMEMWGVYVEELERAAYENTPEIHPWSCSGMREILEECERQSGGDFTDGSETGEGIAAPMKILSNRTRLHGAACILYPGVLEGIAEKEGNLFIIPSSVHETILLPDDGTNSAEALKWMIHEVNRTHVVPEEVLSDSLYYYDLSRKEIVVL